MNRSRDSPSQPGPELVTAAAALLEKLKALPGGQVTITQDIDIKGDRNIVTGQGDVSVKE